jgi:hypothetical protein
MEALQIFWLLSFLVGGLLGYKEKWGKKVMKLFNAIAIIIDRRDEMRIPFHKKILLKILRVFFLMFVVMCLPLIVGIEIMSALPPWITSRKKGKSRRSCSE